MATRTDQTTAPRHKRGPRQAAAAAKLRAPQKPGAAGKLGALPEWNLSDLYRSLDSPELARDLQHADALCLAFEERYTGKLAAIAADPAGGKTLAEAVAQFESIDDLLGRLASYAMLIYRADGDDPGRAKFFGDVQERITTSSSHLLFFSLELNKINDKVLEHAMADPALGHARRRV